MYKLIIFDLDGTLINSVYDLADAVNYGLSVMGYKPHDTEKYKHFVGNGAIKLCERALMEYTDNKSQVLTLHNLFSEYYNAHAMDKTYAYDGIRELLTNLKRQNIRLAVASNKPHEFTEKIVSHIFGSETFDVISGKKQYIPTKPSPQIIYDILKLTDTEKASAIMIGDSDVDVLTAVNAGIKSIGCTWGFRGKDELMRTGADYIADSPEDILPLVL